MEEIVVSGWLIKGQSKRTKMRTVLKENLFNRSMMNWIDPTTILMF